MISTLFLIEKEELVFLTGLRDVRYSFSYRILLLLLNNMSIKRHVGREENSNVIKIKNCFEIRESLINIACKQNQIKRRKG